MNVVLDVTTYVKKKTKHTLNKPVYCFKQKYAYIFYGNILYFAVY